jgi:hypothetical protein
MKLAIFSDYMRKPDWVAVSSKKKKHNEKKQKCKFRHLESVE